MFVHDLDRSQLSCVPLRPAPDPNMRWLSCEVSVKQIDNSVIKTGTVQLWMKEMNQMDGNESYTILPLVFPNSRTITYQVSERKIQIILSNFQDHEIPDFKLVIFKRIRFQ